MNGPNLHLLGRREPETYGTETLDEIMARTVQYGRERGVEVTVFQSNDEGALITRLGESHGRVDGIIINPAGYSHTSVALRDAIRAFGGPCVEVHLSNIHAREDFRRETLTAPVCLGQVSGFKGMGYRMALDGLVDYLQNRGTGGKVKP